MMTMTRKLSAANARAPRKSVGLAILLAIALPGMTAAAQTRGSTHGPDDPYAESTDVTAVEVPVQVIRRGEPVRGLTADDFRIFDEGKRRQITSFEVLDRSADASGGRSQQAAATGLDAGRSAAVRAVPPGERRHFLLLFDLAFSRADDMIRAERAARKLIEEQLDPTDLVGVAVYTPRRGAVTLLRFTSDRQQVLAVLDAFREMLAGKQPADPGKAAPARRDPLRLSTGVLGANLADLGSMAGVQVYLMEEALAYAGPYDGLGGGYELNKMKNFIWHLDQGLRERRSNDVADLSDSLSSLAQETAGIAGPKHLVYFSRGFDIQLLQTRTKSPKVPFVGTEGSVFGIGGGVWILNKVDSMLATMRRAGWEVHAIEMAGPGLSSNYNFRGSLFHLAEETGGKLYENTNDPSVALGEVLERTAVTYLLTFQVANLPEQPAFRRLRVEVDGLPRGATVVHRAGYERPRPWSDLPPARRRAESAEALLAGPDRDHLGVRVLALPQRDGAGGWSVPVALEIDGLALLAGDVRRMPGAEIYAYAFDSEGAVSDLLAHRIEISQPEVRGRLTERGLKFLGDLSLPAGGNYRLRFLVRSLRNGETALKTVPLHLPGETDRPVLLPPVLLGPDADDWIVTTEVDAGAGARPRPFTLYGRALDPAVGSVRIRQGDAAGSGKVLVLGYGLERIAKRLRATVLKEDGTPAGQPVFVARTPGSGNEPDLFIADLPAGLAPGRYTVEVSLAGEDGTVRGRTGTSFRVEAANTGP